MPPLIDIGEVAGNLTTLEGKVVAYAETTYPGAPPRRFMLTLGPNRLDLTSDGTADLTVTLRATTTGTAQTLDLDFERAIPPLTGATIDVFVGTRDLAGAGSSTDLNVVMIGVRSNASANRYGLPQRFTCGQREFPPRVSVSLSQDVVGNRSTITAKITAPDAPEPLAVSIGSATAPPKSPRETADPPLNGSIGGITGPTQIDTADLDKASHLTTAEIEASDGAARLPQPLVPEPVVSIVLHSPRRPAPPAPTVTGHLHGGQMDAGTYSYRYTWVVPIEGESPPSPPSSLITLPPKGAVDIGGIAAGPPATEEQLPSGSYPRLYRSTLSQPHEWRAVTDLAAAQSTTTDDKADADLGAAMPITPTNFEYRSGPSSPALDVHARIRQGPPAAATEIDVSLDAVPKVIHAQLLAAPPPGVATFAYQADSVLGEAAASVTGIQSGPYRSAQGLLRSFPQWVGATTWLAHEQRLQIALRGATASAGTGVDANRPGQTTDDLGCVNLSLTEADTPPTLLTPDRAVVVEREALQSGTRRLRAAVSGLELVGVSLGLPRPPPPGGPAPSVKRYARDLEGLLVSLRLSGATDFAGAYGTVAARSLRIYDRNDSANDKHELTLSARMADAGNGRGALDLDLLPTKEEIGALVEGSLEGLRLDFGTPVLAATSPQGLQLLVESQSTAPIVDFQYLDPLDFAFAPTGPMIVDVTARGFSGKDSPYRSARARLSLAARALKAKVVAKPLEVEFGAPGGGLTEVPGLNFVITSAVVPPSLAVPRQSIVVEHLQAAASDEVWVACSGLEQVSFKVDPPGAPPKTGYAGLGKGMLATLSTSGRGGYGGLYPAVRPRSVRVLQRRQNQELDVRAAELMPAASKSARAQLALDLLTEVDKTGELRRVAILAAGRARFLRVLTRDVVAGNRLFAASPLTAQGFDLDYVRNEKLVLKPSATTVADVFVYTPDVSQGSFGRIVARGRLDAEATTTLPASNADPVDIKVGSEALANPSAKRGFSGLVSLTRPGVPRQTARANPQARLLERKGDDVGPAGLVAMALRVQGVTGGAATIASVGTFGVTAELDPERREKSFRFARDIRAEAGVRPRPWFRVVLAQAPTTTTVALDPPPSPDVTMNPIRLEATPTEKGGWVWFETEDLRPYPPPYRYVGGIGVVSFNIVRIPTSMTLGPVAPPAGSPWLDAAVRVNGTEMWNRVKSNPGWELSAIRIDLKGSAEIKKLLRIAFSRRTDRLGWDEWAALAATELVLTEQGEGAHSLTLFNLNESGNKHERPSGVGFDVEGLTLSTDIDGFSGGFNRPSVPGDAGIHWKRAGDWKRIAEIQMTGFRGGWLADRDGAREFGRDEGFWFVRAPAALHHWLFYVIPPGFVGSDAYFGNTSGNVIGKTRLYP